MAVFRLQLLFFTAAAVALQTATPPPMRKVVQVRELASCEDGEDLPFVVLATRLDIVGRAKMAMNAVGAARKRLQMPNRMEVQLYQCKSFIEPESCEYNSRRLYKNPLEKMYEKNRTWTGIVASIAPPIRFPLSKGRYVMKNATLDIDAKYVDNVDAFEGHYWKIQSDIYLDKKRYFCVLIGAEIANIKRSYSR